MEYAVETFSLTKIFSDWWGRDKVYAVEDLNLKVRYNEVYGLLGPNGSGKTTTLKLLLGLLHPTKGKAFVLGGDSTNPKINARIGFLPEESYLYRFLNARETLDFYGRLFDLPPKLRKLRIEALLDMVGLKTVANRPVGTYSKGMARRIGLAQALINDPDFLILDEPTTGLDPIGTWQIKELLVQLAKRGKTILLSSHLLADVEDICDRISILYGGKIQIEGNVRDLLEHTNQKQITTDFISDASIEKIKQLIENENAQCTVTCPMDKLESFFIRTVCDAQQQEKPTSGAVSTTQISDFLSAQKTQESIIDELVSANPTSQAESQLPLTTEKPTPVETPKTKPDEQLLSKLTQQAEPAESKPVTKTKPVAHPQEKPKDIKENVLDQLTQHMNTTPSDNVKKNNENHNGDAGDA